MCTAIAMRREGELYFGRNMDIYYGFGQAVTVTPRRFALEFVRCGGLSEHYAMIGMGSVRNGYPLYADAVNEKGLCIAALDFPGNAHYFKACVDGQRELAPFELIPWILGRCSELDEAKAELSRIRVISDPFDEKTPNSPLHWLISDKNGSLVAEQTVDGLRAYPNPFDVLTNNPQFTFHAANVCQYLGLSEKSPSGGWGEKLGIKPFSYGFGGIGLPGDYSSASRFVKAAFLLSKSEFENGENACLTQFFHLLSAVEMPRGAVTVENGKFDMTVYSCCMNASRGIYYYKTYGNSRVSAVRLIEENADGEELSIYELGEKQDINIIN